MFFKHGRTDTGFTFLEVMLAASIVATMAFLVVTCFSTTLDAVERARQDHEVEHQARTFHTVIADDLTASHSDLRFPWIGINQDQNGHAADVLAIVTAPSTTHEASIPTSGSVRVVYRLDNDKLIRWEMRNIYGVSTFDIMESEVATDVVAFDLRYFDPVSNQWIDIWDSRSRNSLPKAVMIEIVLRNALRQSQTYTQWITIPGGG